MGKNDLTERRISAFKTNLALALAMDMEIGRVSRCLVAIDPATTLLADITEELRMHVMAAKEGWKIDHANAEALVKRITEPA